MELLFGFSESSQAFCFLLQVRFLFFFAFSKANSRKKEQNYVLLEFDPNETFISG